MSNKKTEKTLRERYFANEIFVIGTLVEDVKTGEKVKILDRGPNYVTVVSSSGISKKWLSEIIEEPTSTVVEVQENTVTDIILDHVEPVEKIDTEFVLLESGQIKMFGHETKNFNSDLSTLIIEQFGEFDDLYSKHQIVKCLDFAMHESDSDRVYDLLEKVDKFYVKQNMHAPFIVEALKNDIERKRIAEILASIANSEVVQSNYTTVVNAIKSLKEKYKTKQQWEVLWPFLKLAQSAGLSGIMVNLPFSFDNKQTNEEILMYDTIIEALEDNLDLLVEDLDFDDINEAFDDSDFIDEELSIEARNKLSRKLMQRAPQLIVRRERAMQRTASTEVLMQRARRLAEVMVKNRIFHKPAQDMSRQEKERYESGAGKRKTLIARLAQRLVGKVRVLQTARMHHTHSPVSQKHDKALANTANGAS